MSEYNTEIGKAKEIKFEAGLSFIEKVEAMRNMGYEIAENAVYENDKYIDLDKFFMVNERVFEVLEKKDYGYDDIAEASIGRDGVVSFVLKYYNGGTSFSAMIEEAIIKMEATTN